MNAPLASPPTALVVAAVLVVAVVVDTLCLAIGYRIHRGCKGLDLGLGELLRQSAIASVCAAVIGAAVGGTAAVFHFRGDEVLAVSLLLFPVYAQVVNLAFRLDDWPAALGICVCKLVPLAALGGLYLVAVS
jgi:hypothetical protein